MIRRLIRHKNRKANENRSDRQLFIRRNLILTGALVLIIGLLIARLVYLQIVQHSLFTTLSKQNQLNVNILEPARGLIYDRNGVVLAENIPAFSLDITLERSNNLKDTLKRLQKIIHISDTDLHEFYRLLKQRRSYEPVPIKLKLTEEEVATFAVNQYYFPGVTVKATLMRHYPNGEAFAHILGYVARINVHEFAQVNRSNYSASNFIGKVGIEKFYESQLHGVVGYEQVETNATGRIIRVTKRVPPHQGDALYLSIDSELQHVAEEALGENQGAIVAIDPGTGEILAMVSEPSYDPNVFVAGITAKEYKELSTSPTQPLYNRALRGQYPMASTIKPFVAVAGLDFGVITPRFSISDPGWFSLPQSSHVYRDWRKGGHGRVNVRRAVIVSCDTFFFNLANMLGIRRLADMLNRFGFGHYTEIDIGEELPGIVANPDWKRRAKGAPWYTGDTVNAGVGQGFMLTTPLQLAQATATLANRGKRIRPHFLLRSVSSNGVTTPLKLKPEYPVKLQDEETWDLVITAMEEVITSGEGTGYKFGRDAPYHAAAKTGTAQVFTSKYHDRKDEENLPKHLRDHSLFIIFAPAKQPKIALAVIAENSSLASHVARKVMDYYLLGVRPIEQPVQPSEQ